MEYSVYKFFGLFGIDCSLMKISKYLRILNHWKQEISGTNYTRIIHKRINISLSTEQRQSQLFILIKLELYIYIYIYMKLYYEKIFRVYLLMSTYCKLTQIKIETYIFQISYRNHIGLSLKAKKSCKFLSLQRQNKLALSCITVHVIYFLFRFRAIVIKYFSYCVFPQFSLFLIMHKMKIRSSQSYTMIISNKI